MQSLVRKRLAALLLPVLGLMLAAAWLGFCLAEQAALQPQQSQATAQQAHGGEVLAAVLPALLMLLVLAVMAYRAAYKALSPWVTLAQQVQQRAPKDFQAIAIEDQAPLEVRAMAGALNRLFEKASAESDAQQRFIADAAHQLRTPLAALQSQVEAWALMAQAAPNQTIVLPCAQVERLRQASRRTTQLANQLLVLSRVDRSWRDAGTPAQRVDIKSLCEAVLESFLDAALAKNFDLGLEAEPAHVSGHAWLLREMIGNILDNAIKYTPSGGQITVRCGRRSEAQFAARVFIEIEDDGPGVPVCEYTHLTQRFYRLAGAAADGSGLGLAIVQEIAQAHGAQLRFGSGVGGRGLSVLLLFQE